MWEFETDVQRIQHTVLTQIARLALERRRDYLFDEIPKTVIPDAKPQFRCCVYRERAIVQERVRLALPQATAQIVHVIKPACEQCPVHRVSVTSSCQGCISKRCKETCPVGAISIVNKRAQIDYDKCLECGRCSKVCPYVAITDHQRPCKAACPVNAISVGPGETAIIDEEKCINCGKCISGCPFGAIGEKTFLLDVLDLMVENRPLNAVIAPSIVGQFPGVSIGQIKNAIKRLGFSHVFEVAMGADETVRKEAHELQERLQQNEPMTTSCCASFVQLIKKHYPGVLKNVSTTPSPMAEIVSYLESLDSEAHTVFIGPCVSKKAEMIERFGAKKQFVLTFMELDALFDAKEIDPKTCQEEELNDASRLGRSFPWSGGVTEAILEYLQPETPIQTLAANGVEECVQHLRK
jgi:[FeFe] hydrogenase (group B1/B3)